MSRLYLWFRANKGWSNISLSLLHIEPQMWSRQFNSTFFFFQCNDQFDPQMCPRQFNSTFFSFCLVFVLQIANLILKYGHHHSPILPFSFCLVFLFQWPICWRSHRQWSFDLSSLISLLCSQLQRKLVFLFFTLHWTLYVGWYLKIGGKLNTLASNL